eukprot:2422251-Alexandrium_andersonii.AAC.1
MPGWVGQVVPNPATNTRPEGHSAEPGRVEAPGVTHIGCVDPKAASTRWKPPRQTKPPLPPLASKEAASPRTAACNRE